MYIYVYLSIYLSIYDMPYLLEVGREAVHVLVVGQYRVRLGAEEVAVPVEPKTQTNMNTNMNNTPHACPR